MQTEEVHLKVNAIHRLKTVIAAIGIESTVNDLIPYLDLLVDKEEDEVLFAIAEELGKVWEMIQNKTVFIPILERLGRSDETVVREQATKSLIAISKSLTDSDMQNVFSPMVIRLAQCDFFVGRVSSCALFEHAYPRSNSMQERLRKKFLELCQEDTPMIRRACASQLGLFSTKLERDHVINELLPIFRQLSSDEQDAIRVLCIESLIPLAQSLNKQDNCTFTLGSLLAAGEDKSWKVRLCFAKNFAKFANSFGKEITDSNLIQTFNTLLTENECEPEVRNAAIVSLSQSLEYLSTEKICNILLPTLTSSYFETQVQFKAGLAIALCQMSPIVGQNYTEKNILPVLQELLKDESSEVRLNVVSNLNKLAEIAGSSLLSPALLTILNNLTKD
jgi:serine/threonine-protein phosphatase 2A regulatory subunit A